MTAALRWNVWHGSSCTPYCLFGGNVRPQARCSLDEERNGSCYHCCCIRPVFFRLVVGLLCYCGTNLGTRNKSSQISSWTSFSPGAFKLSNMCLVAFAVVLLCSVSVSRSSPVACEDLLRPSDRQDPHHLEGQWAVVAASLSHLPDLEQFKQRESAAVTYSRNHSDSNISYTRSILVENRCLYATFNISLQGSGFTFDGTPQTNLSAHFVRSCRDCTLMRIDLPLEKKTNLYLFSRRRGIGQQEMEEFRAQVQCLNMPPPVVMDAEKELCPAETTAAQSEN